MSISGYIIMGWSVSVVAAIFFAYRAGISRGESKKIKEEMERAEDDAKIVLKNKAAGPRSGRDLLDSLRKWERSGDPR